MPTYSSTNVTDKKGVAGSSTASEAKIYTYTVTCAAAPTTSDPLQFGFVPAGFRLSLAILEATDMDTNGSPTITLNVGDAGSAARIFSASTVAQAGTLSSAIATAGAGYQYTSKTLITGVAQANATTGAAGSITLTLIGVVDDL